MSKVILQLVHDDKFTDCGIARFEEAAPNSSRYLAIDSRTPNRYAKSPLIEQLDVQEIVRILRSDSYSSLVVHGLTDQKAAILRYVRRQVSRAWIGWGFDYYSSMLQRAFPDGQLAPLTLLFAQDLGRAPRNRLQRLRAYAGRFRYRHSLAKRRRLRRFDYFIPVLRSEWMLARKLNPWFKADYLPWNYASDWGACSNEVGGIEKRNILIGNSASLTNNHIDAFDAVARNARRMAYDHVYVPLSYGGSATVVDRLKDVGYSYFKDKFVPIDDMLPVADYRKLIASCHTVVLNHIRQQGAGNVSLAAQLGAKIVLNPLSPLCEELNRRGVAYETIDRFSIGELDSQTMEKNKIAQQIETAYRCDKQRTIDLCNALRSGQKDGR